MAKGYSRDLRDRAVAMVEEGGSRREVARILDFAPSTSVCWRDLVADEPDLTLEEIRDRLAREKKLAVAVSSVWRFFDRHEITFKRSTARDRAGPA